MIGVSRGTSGISDICSRCGVEPRRPAQRWCRSCHAAYMRSHRARPRPADHVAHAAFVELLAVAAVLLAFAALVLAVGR